MFLSTGDPNFNDLFRTPGVIPQGIRLIVDANGATLGASVLIAGYAGSGKTTLACHLCAASLLINNKEAAHTQCRKERWPQAARAVILTLDQRPHEIVDMIHRLSPELNVPNGVGEFHLPSDNNEGDVVPDESDSIGIALSKSSIVIRRLPYESTLNTIALEIAKFTSCQDYAVALVVVDSINFAAREAAGVLSSSDRHGKMNEFRNLLGHGVVAGGKKPIDRRYSTILTFEIDDRLAFPEEYLAQVSILLTRDNNDDSGRRLIEIRKARHQHHFVGRHDLRIDNDGVYVFPSVVARAKILQQEEKLLQDKENRTQQDDGNGAADEIIDFGFPLFDEKYKSETIAKLHRGSATLLWGPPGTAKSDLLIKFLVEQWRGNIDSRVLLLTTKINPTVVLRDLFIEVVNDENLFKALGNSETDVINGIKARLETVDARNPYLLHSMTMTKIVDAVERGPRNAKSKWPVERSVVFGLGLIEDAPENRDHQWRFLSLLVSYLSHQRVSSLLIDWPTLGAGIAADPRPRASVLCANEIETSTEPPPGSEMSKAGGYTFWLRRANYAHMGIDVACSPEEVEVRRKV